MVTVSLHSPAVSHIRNGHNLWDIRDRNKDNLSAHHQNFSCSSNKVHIWNRSCQIQVAIGISVMVNSILVPGVASTVILFAGGTFTLTGIATLASRAVKNKITK